MEPTSGGCVATMNRVILANGTPLMSSRIYGSEPVLDVLPSSAIVTVAELLPAVID